jgi:very-short-patch-repair endonuclease
MCRPDGIAASSLAMPDDPVLATYFGKDAPGLVAVITKRADLNRARSEHWFRIPLRSAPEIVPSSRWVAFYLTAPFGPHKWSVRYWAAVKEVSVVRRVELLPGEPDHPWANDWYYRLGLESLQERPEPIFSRRWRRIVFIPSVWHKFVNALEINDLHQGSQLEDRLWAAFKQEGIDGERQWFEGTLDAFYCLDFAVFCPERNIDVECDGDKWHSNPQRALEDNARNAFLEQRGWHVLRFNSAQLNEELPHCVQNVKNAVQRSGGVRLPDGSVRLFTARAIDPSPMDPVLLSKKLQPQEDRGAQTVPKSNPSVGEDKGEIDALLALPNQHERRAALAELKNKYGTDELAMALARSLKTAPSRLQEHAVWCLGELGPCPAAVEGLIECLAKEISRTLRRLTYSACAKIGDARFEELIVAKLEEEKEQGLQHALLALAKCGSRAAISSIERVLSHPQPPYITKAANKALRHCQGP